MRAGGGPAEEMRKAQAVADTKLMDEVIHQLREAGIRMTIPRRLIVEAAISHKRRFTAEELLMEARRQDGMIALPTVYRTLSILEQNGVIHKSGFGEERQSYEWGPGGKTRMVIVCESCGEHIHVEDPCLEIRQRYLLKQLGYDPLEIRLEVRARCQKHGPNEVCTHCHGTGGG